MEVNSFYILLRREWMLERRHKHAISGLFLYIASTIFVCYLSFEEINKVSTWNALLWIILLFVTTSASHNSFRHESGKNTLYYYTILNPRTLILAKMVYHAMLNMVLCALAYIIYALVLGDMVLNQVLFFTSIALGSTGLSFLLTMNAAIVSKSDNNTSMMAILSFPLVLPLLLTLIKLSSLSMIENGWHHSSSLLLILLALNVLIAALAYLLFPYLWRE